MLISFMAAYAIVRASAAAGSCARSNSLFLMGLAIPLQATIIPVYLIIIRLQMYDTLPAIILPSIAFAIPLSVLVLTNFIRDVPKELFESMRMDGATEWGTLWHLAFPLTRPALVTVTIYNGLGIWNGFLLPLILTQSPDTAHPAAGAVDASRASTASTSRPCSPRSSSPPCRSCALRDRPASAAERPHGRLRQVTEVHPHRGSTSPRGVSGLERRISPRRGHRDHVSR